MTQRRRGLTCPQCRRRAYFVCSRRSCVCHKLIPKGKRPLRWTKDGERQRCPYCGFTAHADLWFDRACADLPRFEEDANK